jgi:hypothetical protein
METDQKKICIVPSSLWVVLSKGNLPLRNYLILGELILP